MKLHDGLFLLFLLEKMEGRIGWPWWWVTAPLWIHSILFCFFRITGWGEPKKPSIGRDRL